MVDMAHFAGLVAAGLHPNPVEHADVVTSTTHKTLAGPALGLDAVPRGARHGDRPAVFPGLQGGPLCHVMAAKAVCFKHRRRARRSASTSGRSVANAAAHGRTG